MPLHHQRDLDGRAAQFIRLLSCTHQADSDEEIPSVYCCGMYSFLVVQSTDLRFICVPR